MLKRWFQDLVYLLITPLTTLLVKLKISPNALTILGLLLNGVAAFCFIQATLDFENDGRWLVWAATFILLGGLFDILDGRVARLSGLQRKEGALFDSVVDRYAELIMFFGLGIYMLCIWYLPGLIACFVALAGSLMVSYTRARIEGLGGTCQVGIMQRPERIVLISLGVLIYGINGGLGYTSVVFEPYHNQYSIHHSFVESNINSPELWILFVPLSIVAIFSNITAIRRLIHGYRILQEMPPEE